MIMKSKGPKMHLPPKVELEAMELKQAECQAREAAIEQGEQGLIEQRRALQEAEAELSSRMSEVGKEREGIASQSEQHRNDTRRLCLLPCLHMYSSPGYTPGYTPAYSAAPGDSAAPGYMWIPDFVSATASAILGLGNSHILGI